MLPVAHVLRQGGVAVTEARRVDRLVCAANQTDDEARAPCQVHGGKYREGPQFVAPSAAPAAPGGDRDDEERLGGDR